MAQVRKTLVDRLYNWRLLATNLRNDLGEFPQLGGEVAELERIDAEATALIVEIAQLRGNLQRSTARLRVVARRGDMLRTRVGAILRGILGFDSIRLIGYGLRPRPRHQADEASVPSPALQPETAEPVEILDDLGESEPS
ncbi:MAG TPA: hypothetical protein VIH93_06290 [Thermoanaerobaculia bacterium]|jgi:hypothetical protein